jgi:hypothetical protein
LGIGRLVAGVPGPSHAWVGLWEIEVNQGLEIEDRLAFIFPPSTHIAHPG